MFIEKLIKKNFISFYHDKEYLLLLEIVKNKKILSSYKETFDSKKKLASFIKEKIQKTPQTYVSTIIFSLNQGVIDSCDKKAYLLKDIDYNNIKTICINNKYSFYTSIYDLNKLKKEYDFEIDFIYSVFAVIDVVAKERKNRFYVLVFKTHIALLAYENYIPKYSDIIEIEDKEDDIEEIEEIDDLDLIDDSLDELGELDDIEDIDEIEEFENIEEKLNNLTTGIEVNILNFLKESLKEYYENYSNDFIEKIIILDAAQIDTEITKLIEDELLIPAEYQQIDVLKTINRLSIESL